MEVIVAAKFVSERNIKFLLYEVFDVESLTEYEYYQDHNRKMFDMVLKAAVKLGKDLLFPIFEEMDRRQPELLEGEVKAGSTWSSFSGPLPMEWTGSLLVAAD